MTQYLLRYVHPSSWYLVMLRLRPKAKSRAKPAVKKPSQARPISQLEMAFGPAQGFTKPEPGALAAAFYSSISIIICCDFLERFPKMMFCLFKLSSKH